MVALGYAGWSGGQLEREITENAWLSGPADYDVIFNTPLERRWAAAARLLGVDMSLISSEAGHA
jgi:putative transcriptional regulator